MFIQTLPKLLQKVEGSSPKIVPPSLGSVIAVIVAEKSKKVS
jgi:hypothetical protein